jgi:hypothetical protein
VPVLPLNLHPRPSRQMDQYRLRIVPHPRRVIRQRHKFQYRMCEKVWRGHSRPAPTYLWTPNSCFPSHCPAQ